MPRPPVSACWRTPPISFAFREVRLAGRALGEPGIYGAYAGQLGVPVALVTGDDRLVEEARDLFPQAEAVCVKTALSNHAARQIGVEKARAAIAAGAGSRSRTYGPCGPLPFRDRSWRNS